MLFGVFITVLLTFIISFVFGVDTVSGTKTLNGIPLIAGTATFIWIGAFPVVISVMVMMLIGLSIVGGSA